MKTPRALPDSAALRPIPATIGFRMDEASRRLLAERAAKLEVSVHTLAHFYVVDTLRLPQEREELREAIKAFHAQVFKMREELANTAAALLIKVGKVTPPEAEQWVRDTFK